MTHSAPGAAPPAPSAAETEDQLLATLATQLQAERQQLAHLQQRSARLRRLLDRSHDALRGCRDELAQARQAAGRDALTGLPNRRGFEPPLRRELARHASGPQVLALLFVDLDGFKAVNDQFVCLLPQLHSATRAGVLAAALLRSIAQPCVLGGQVVEVHASIGVAIYPRDGDSLPLLMRSADSAMYAAKARRSGIAMAPAAPAACAATAP